MILEVNKLVKIYKSRKATFLSYFLNYHSMDKGTKVIDSISFQIDRNQSLSVIGLNGAGKSTLLKIITGTIQPTSGSINIKERVASILELGSMFINNMTGEENVRFLLKLDGYKNTIEEVFKFAQLTNYKRHQISTFSSGMISRLAISIHITNNPKLLIIDEALAVGDISFRLKCIERIKLLQRNSCTLLLATHSLQLAQTLTQKTILLDKGKIIYTGTPSEASTKYQKINNYSDKSLQDLGDIDIKNYGLTFSKNKEYVNIEYKIITRLNVNNIAVGIRIRDKFGSIVLGTNTACSRYNKVSVKNNGISLIKIKNNFNNGEYFVSLSCAVIKDYKLVPLINKVNILCFTINEREYYDEGTIHTDISFD